MKYKAVALFEISYLNTALSADPVETLLLYKGQYQMAFVYVT